MDSRSKTIAKNTLYLYIRTAITMLISLYTSRVILNALGETDFGIYNLVGGVVVLFSFINTALVASTQRFLNFEIGSKNEEGVGHVFSISIVAHLIVAVIIVFLAETIGLWLMENKVNIPLEKKGIAMIVYQLSIVTTVSSIIRCPYNASIIAYEKMSFFAWISIVEAIFKLLVALIIEYDKKDRLLAYAILMLGISIIITIIYWAYCQKKLEEIRFRLVKDYKLLKEMLLFSIWNLLGNAANVGVNQGLGIILNIFYGVLVNTAIGISNQISALASAFVSNFQTAFMPQITKSYASGDSTYLNTLIIKSSIISFLLVYIISIPLYSSCGFVLKIWLGMVPEYSVEFTRVILLCTMIEALSGPLWMAVHATGNIKTYQIVISITLLSSLGLCYLVCLSNLGAVIGYLTKAIILLAAMFFRLLYLTQALKYNLRTYLQDVVKKAIILIILGIIVIQFTTLIPNEPISLIVVIIMTLLISIFIGLSSIERKKIYDFVIHKIENKHIS